VLNTFPSFLFYLEIVPATAVNSPLMALSGVENLYPQKNTGEEEVSRRPGDDK
jgi:hypothetical protein